MTIEAEKTKTPETSTTPKKGEIEKITKKDVVSNFNDEELERQKERYGKWVESFVKGIRVSEEYWPKCKWMTDYEVLEFGKSEPGLKEYHKKYIDRTPKNMENYDAVGHINSNEFWSYSPKEYTRLRKEKWQEAAARYEQQWKTTKLYKKPEDKEKESITPEKGKEEKKEEKKEDKPAEKKEDTKDTPKESPKVEKPETKPDEKKDGSKEEKKETPPIDKATVEDPKPATIDKAKDEKKSEKKSFRKKLNPKNRFPKKEKKADDKKSEKWFWKTTGDVVTYLPKQAWKATEFTAHQTANLIKYPIRTARSTVKFGRQYMDHGFSKVRREKNKDAYLAKWKWEQAKKK